MSLPTRILVIGPSWVGDMVMSQSLFKQLQLQNPQAKIDVLAPAWSVPVLARMPEVHRAIVSEIEHGVLGFRQRYRLAQQLKQHQYDQAIIIPRSFKSALIPWMARIPKRTGWLGEYRYGLLNDARKLDKKHYPTMQARLVALAFPAKENLPTTLPHPALHISQDQLQATNQQFAITPGKQPILAICPGAEFGSSKRWPTKHFAEIARHFILQNWQVWIFGSIKEKALADEIQQQTNHQCVNFIGKSSLPQSIDLISQVDMVLTNDSGLMHVAASFDKPLIALFGSTPQSYTPPLSANAKILSLNLECSPCKKRSCPLNHHACLNNITPHMVLSAMTSFIPAILSRLNRDPRSNYAIT